MKLSPRATIVGTGMTVFGRHADRSVRSLAAEATTAALADAGVSPAEVGMVFFGNAAGGVLHGQEMIRGQSALRHVGFESTPFFNVENACASSSSAFALAVMAVSSGVVDVALAVGAERLTHADKTRSVTAIATAVDLEEDGALRRLLSGALLGWDGEVIPPDPDHQFPSGPELAPGGSKFMDIYAEITRDYLEHSGGSIRDLAGVVVKSRANAALNPRAQFRDVVTEGEVLASRVISDPLTLMMCSPVGDGAAAVVVCSPEFAAVRAAESVQVRAVSVVSGCGYEAGKRPSTELAVQRAYEQAGIEPGDIDVVELHDAAATGELTGYEDLRLCGPYEGAALLASGATQIGGRVPVNPSGGLLSRGHPIGATGCAQIVELADQLRGRCGARQVGGARIAVAKNSGGYLGDDPGATVVTVLGG